MNKDRKKNYALPRLLALAVLSAAVLVGCDVDDAESLDDDAAEHESDEGELRSIVTLGDPDDARIVASIAFPDLEATIRLYDLGGGDVLAAEVSHHASMLDRFMDADATALEMFTSTAPDDMVAPEVLHLAHEAERGNTEPRNLLAGSTFRHWNQQDAQYATDCSLANDGQAYFDGRWQSLGWTNHVYHYLNNRVFNDEDNMWTGWTKKFRAHVCVRDAEDWVRHWVFLSNGPALPAAATGPFDPFFSYIVLEGERSIVYLVHSHKNRVFLSTADAWAVAPESADFNHGLMWP